MPSLRQKHDDDFVFTLSDDEIAINSSEEEQDVQINQERGLQNGTKDKKRKRNGTETADKLAKRAKKINGTASMPQKKNAKQPMPVQDSDDESGDGNARWAERIEEEDDGAMASDFDFEVDGDMLGGVTEGFDGWGDAEATKKSGGDKKGVDIDEIISRRRAQTRQNGDVAMGEEDKIQEPETVDNDEEEEFNGLDDDDELLAADAFGMGTSDGLDAVDEAIDDGDENDSNNTVSEEGESDQESVASGAVHPLDLEAPSSDEEVEDPAELKRRAAFFAPEEKTSKPQTKKKGLVTFQNMSLSRPILKGLAAIGFSEPTPIQVKAVPVALLGKDVVGGAVTGSGKTAAFMIPILERLLYRPKKVPTTRVAILMPTRELAVQCYNVARKLASFTDITFAQIVGGFSVREQEQVLKKRPDVIIATPGRFIDHMRNSPNFAVDTLEILVLDEADRMLEDGFADELNEILKTIPKSRQTMLFSATMTDDIDKLIRVGMHLPVRLMVDAKKQTVSGLVQEFVRLRPGREDKRLAYLIWLCENVYKDRVIIFFRQKKEAHRVRVIFGLCGFKAAELHGSMTQEQRIEAVESFRSGKVSYLLATDLASRGLDIKNVNTVINYEAPQSHEIYLHRVGRTARAGRTGRACTLAAEPDRKIVKAAVKAAKAQGAKIASRTIPPAEADDWAARIDELKDDIEAVLVEEKEEKALNTADRDLRKSENLITYEDEIKARPKRTWFENEKDKRTAQDRGRAELNGDEAVVKKGSKKLSNKQKKRLDLRDERKDVRMWKKGKKDVAALKQPNKKSKGGKSKVKVNGAKKN